MYLRISKTPLLGVSIKEHCFILQYSHHNKYENQAIKVT